MAVSHHQVRLLQAIHHGSTQRHHKRVARLQMLMRLRNLLIHQRERGFLIGKRVARVEIVTVPHTAALKQVDTPLRHRVDDAIHT